MSQSRWQVPPPHGGATRSTFIQEARVRAFQPAPPARRATGTVRVGFATPQISTRAPRTEGDITPKGLPTAFSISTRAPRTEGDPKHFNPRPPAPPTRAPRRRATVGPVLRRLHGGRLGSSRKSLYFNPRPPHGGRHPAGGRSTRAPRTEGDPERRITCNFNPRPPHGGRRAGRISTRAPRTDRRNRCVFQPAPPARRATAPSTRAPRTRQSQQTFQPAPPARRAT